MEAPKWNQMDERLKVRRVILGAQNSKTKIKENSRPKIENANKMFARSLELTAK